MDVDFNLSFIEISSYIIFIAAFIGGSYLGQPSKRVVGIAIVSLVFSLSFAIIQIKKNTTNINKIYLKVNQMEHTHEHNILKRTSS